MPFIITCPECATRMRSRKPVALGRSVPCPGCGIVFSATEENCVEVAAGETSVTSSSTSTPRASDSEFARLSEDEVKLQDGIAPPLPITPPQASSPLQIPKATVLPSEPEPADEPSLVAGSEWDQNEEKDPKALIQHEDDEKDRPRAKDRRDDYEDDRPGARRQRDDEDRSRVRGRRDDYEDDRPRASRQREDDYDDRPRSKSRPDDDYDDRPRSKSRRDDDYDDRPRSKSRRNDDFDDRPRSRGRRDDDYDDARERRRYDDDPRTRRAGSARKSRRKSSGNLPLVIALFAGGGLLLIGMAVGVYFLFFSGGGSFDTAMIAYLPDDTTSIEGTDVEAVMNVDWYKKRVMNDHQERVLHDNDLLKSAGYSIEDVSRLVQGHTKKGDQITVLKFKKSVDKNKMIKAIDGKEAKEGNRIYYEGEVKETKEDPRISGPKGASGTITTSRKYCLHFPSDSDTLLVMTSNKESMKNAINSESGKVRISQDLQVLAKGAAGKGDSWSASKMQQPEGVKIQFGAGMQGLLGSSHWISIGNTLKTGSREHYESEAAAEKVFDEFKKIRESMKEKAESMMPGANQNNTLTPEQKRAWKEAWQSSTYDRYGEDIVTEWSLDITPFLIDQQNVPGFFGF